MASKPDPLDMGPDELQALLIGSGLRLARDVGFGLPLVNALREEFPDVELQPIGQAARTVGAGVNAATLLKAGPGGETIDLDIVPKLPNYFFEGYEPERLRVVADVEFDQGPKAAADSDGGRQTWNVVVECGEGITMDELIACIEDHFNQMIADWTDPDIDVNAEINKQINFYFIGKRF